MQDKINNLERNLSAANSERGQLQDRVNKYKQVSILFAIQNKTLARKFIYNNYSFTISCMMCHLL